MRALWHERAQNGTSVHRISTSSGGRIGQTGRVPDLDLMLADLATLVNVESPSRDLDALARSAGALAALMEQRLGGTVSVIDSAVGPHVHWSGGGAPKVLVLGHHDTVFPIGSLAARPFTVADGRATGPGVFDMKAGIVQAIHGLAELDDLSGVEIIFSADEETGSRNSRAFIEERALACGAALVLEPSADGGALKIARKGTGTFELLVHGRAAHAGLEPEKGINAVVEAAHQILEVTTFADTTTGTTVTPTMASAGTADNVVPALATITIDVRVEAAGEKERIEAAMAGLQPHLADSRLELRGGINRPPMPSSASAWLFPLAEQVAADLGLPAVAGVAVGGGSDGNFTAARGVATLDGLGAVGGGAHADHEYVVVDTMPDRARLLAGIVAALQRR
ncbi:MAG: M20/M25/M40 family metallo-hydrolase [Actinobacteria bacterium]|nr:M20/M25/M40 family metallo-hydrolase [Actinomycetota bacterium]